MDEFKGKITRRSRNSVVFDVLLVEQDRIKNLRIKDLDLYYLDETVNEYRVVGEAYKEQINEVKKSIFKKKKARYFITFSETFDMEDTLKPISLKIIRFMARNMNYDNTLKGYGHRDFENYTNSSMRYITKAIKELEDKNIIKFETNKGRRRYMINPIFYYKGSLLKLFYYVKKYEDFSHDGKQEITL